MKAPALPLHKSLVPVIVGAVLTVGVAAMIALYVITRPRSVAPAESNVAVSTTTTVSAALLPTAALPVPTVTASATPSATPTASAAPAKTATGPRVPTAAVTAAATASPAGGKGKKSGQVVTDYGY